MTTLPSSPTCAPRLQDTLFDGDRPDLPQLRAAQIHSPDLVSAMLKLHRAYHAATDQLMTMAAGGDEGGPVVMTSPEAAVHNFFRRNHNHFEALEAAAEAFWGGRNVAPDDVYAEVKAALRDRLGLRVRLVRVEDMPDTLREYDEAGREVLLSEALDHPNRVFQLVHVAGLIENRALFDEILAGLQHLRRARPRAVPGGTRQLLRRRRADALRPIPGRGAGLEIRFRPPRHALRGQFRTGLPPGHDAAAVRRAGGAVLLSQDRQGGQRHQALQRHRFHLAEYGGACPRLDVHTSFRVPGRIVPQFVEMPDTSQFFVFARTVDRPSVTRHAQDVRLAVAMGCAVEHIGPHRLCRGFRRQPRASHAHRHQLPHLPADELRPARPQRHGAQRTAGRTPARHHALRKLKAGFHARTSRHGCGVSSAPHSD
jgi:predicted transcriptional regulator